VAEQLQLDLDEWVESADTFSVRSMVGRFGASNRATMLLDWVHRHPTLHTVGVCEFAGRSYRAVAPQFVTTEAEALGAYRRVFREHRGKWIAYWPPRLHRWWRPELNKTRLPVFGQTQLDRAVAEAMDDFNFGAWLMRNRTNRLELRSLLELYDAAIECPTMASVHDMDRLVANGYDGEFVDDEDTLDHEAWLESHARACDLDDCCHDSPFQGRSIHQVILAGGTGPVSDAYLVQREKWLSWRVGVALGEEIANTRHVCASEGDLTPPARPGVYAVKGAGNFVKIGKGKNIAQRLRDIQTNHPVPLRLLAVLSDDPEDEKLFHSKLAAHRAHGEWFRLEDEVLEVIRKARDD